MMRLLRYATRLKIRIWLLAGLKANARSYKSRIYSLKIIWMC
jgi:hypothetical protein